MSLHNVGLSKEHDYYIVTLMLGGDCPSHQVIVRVKKYCDGDIREFLLAHS